MKKHWLWATFPAFLLIGGILLFLSKHNQQAVPSYPITAEYALKSKKSSILYPLKGNQSAAYTEFYQLAGIEIQSTNGKIEIPYSKKLQNNYVIYDFINNCDISISTTLQTDTIYYDCGKLVIISAAKSNQSP